ncbi:Ig-like domain-containing protein [Archangium sp.]|uniref:Ig-like domain-containing protein n=1 Tax=Archangium sp. TaxID=1872627 RepID=UPI003899E560
MSPVNGALINNSSPPFSGTAEPGNTITVFIDGSPVGTTTSDAAGNWTLTPSALPDGSHSVRATATNGLGETSPDSNTNTFVIDTTPPAKPVVNTPANGSLLVTARPVVTGTAEPGTTVTVILDGSFVGTVTADASGNWSFSPTTDLPDGSHAVSARARDASGNVSPDSNTNAFTIDTTLPDTFILSAPPASTSATSATFDFESTEPGFFECRLDGASFVSCSDPVTFTDLSEGLHTLEVRARDTAGNVDATPAVYTWRIGPDPVLPGPTITTPAHGSVISDTSPTYSGTAGPGLDVLVKREDGSELCRTTADPTGAWSCVEPTTLADGPHTVVAVSSNASGPVGDPASTTFTVTTPVTEDDPSSYLYVYGRGCSSSGGSPLPWLMALLLAVPLMRSRRTRSTARESTVATGLLALAMLAAPAARAQSIDPSLLSQSIDVQRYKPGPGAMDLLGVHGAQLGRDGWHLGASLGYANDTLGFFDSRQNGFVYEVVATQMTLDLMGSVSFCERFELGMALPLTYQASERGVASPPAFAEGVTGAGLGDLRMVPKVRLVSAGGLHLGVAIPVLLPTAGGKAFRGGTGVAVQPQLLGEWASSGGLRLVANVGIHVRGEERLLTLRTGTEWLYALGAQVPVGERLAVQAQLAGALGLRERDAEERPLELLGAVRYRVSDGLRAHVGGGPGLTRGYGTPGFRVFAGLDWTPPEPSAR